MFLSKWQFYRTPKYTNPYEIHKLLWQAFPDQPEAERPFLFRMEGKAQSRFQTIIMQSSTQPVETESENLELIGSKGIHPDLRNGQHLRFLVRANPVKRLNQERKRVPLIHDEQQIAWLQNKLQAAADISPEQIQVEQKNALYFRKAGKGGKIVTVTFSGLLQVIDHERLLQSMQAGIGPAKCFGCGLLSLARV